MVCFAIARYCAWPGRERSAWIRTAGARRSRAPRLRTANCGDLDRVPDPRQEQERNSVTPSS